MDKLERLEKEFNEANDKKLQLQRDVEECAARLERAKKLIGGLGGERTRWTESCASLELSYAKLVGDVQTITNSFKTTPHAAMRST